MKDKAMMQTDKCSDILIEIAEKFVNYDFKASIGILRQIIQVQTPNRPKINFYIYSINFQMFLNRSDYVTCQFLLDLIFKIVYSGDDSYL